jgi:hypothetical protein
MVARGTSADTVRPVLIRFNEDTTSSYSSHDLFGTGSSVASDGSTSGTFSFFGYISSASAAANSFGAGVCDILDPFETTKNTTFRTLSGVSNADQIIILNSGAYLKTDAITSLTLDPFSGSFAADSRFSLYGLKASV